MLPMLLAILLIQDQDPQLQRVVQGWSDCLFRYAHEQAQGIQTPHWISGRAFDMCRWHEGQLRTQWARVHGRHRVEQDISRLKADARPMLSNHVERARQRGFVR